MAGEPTKLDDGGPAFPHHTAISNPEGMFHLLHEYGLCVEGMSKREHYACEAMKALIIALAPSSEAVKILIRDACDREEAKNSRERISRFAVKQADSLLAELKRTKAAPERRGGLDPSDGAFL